MAQEVQSEHYEADVQAKTNPTVVIHDEIDASSSELRQPADFHSDNLVMEAVNNETKTSQNETQAI